MSDTKILQAILDSVATLRKEVKDGFASLGKEVKKNTERIDKLGAQIASIQESL